MRPLIVVLVSVIALGPAWGNPTPKPTPRELPTGSYVQVDKDKVKFFTLEEFKIILHIYADYKSWFYQVPKLKLQITKLNLIKDNQKRQIQLVQKNNSILKSELDRMTKKWEKENKLRHLCENKPAFGSWLAWGSAGAMGLVAAVLAIVLIVKKD